MLLAASDSPETGWWAAAGSLVVNVVLAALYVWRTVRKQKGQEAEKAQHMTQQKRHDAVNEAWEHVKQLKLQHKTDLQYLLSQCQACHSEISALRQTEREAVLKAARLEELNRYLQQELVEADVTMKALRDEVKSLRDELHGKTL